MDSIQKYLITVICAALFCGVINGLWGKKGTNTALIKLISGAFMVLTVISPLTKFDFSGFSALSEEISLDTDSVVRAGEEFALNEMNEFIIQKTRAYILDKATSLGMDVSVAVSLNCDLPPVPNTVTISGAGSPYAKKVLTKYIEDTFAIPKENQIWI